MIDVVMAAAVILTPFPSAWAQFGRAGGLGATSEIVEIGTGDRKDSGTFQYELRLTRKTLRGSVVLRANSIDCPVIRSVVASMSQIAMPRPAPFGDAPRSTIMDGTVYTLTVPSTDASGKITISANVGSPLAKWVKDAFKALEPCWTSQAS